MRKKCRWTCRALEPIDLACTLDGLLSLWAFVAHLLVTWNILFTEFSDLSNAGTFRSSLTLMKNYHKPHRKNLSVLGSCHSLRLSKFQVLLKSLNFITGNKYSELFLLTQQINFIHFQYYVCQKLSHRLFNYPFFFLFSFFRYYQCKCQQRKRQIMWYYYAGSFHLVRSLKRITNLETTLL